MDTMTSNSFPAHEELTDAELLAAAQPIALSCTEGMPQLDKVFIIYYFYGEVIMRVALRKDRLIDWLTDWMNEWMNE